MSLPGCRIFSASNDRLDRACGLAEVEDAKLEQHACDRFFPSYRRHVWILPLTWL
jgi:hypothetical protein